MKKSDKQISEEINKIIDKQIFELIKNHRKSKNLIPFENKNLNKTIVEEQRKLVTRLIAATNKIKKNSVSEASYIQLSTEQINQIAKEFNINKEEAIYILKEYFKPKK